MLSNFDNLISRSKSFKESIENLKIGAKSYQNSIPIEENVVRLKQIIKFLNSKLQAINVDYSRENGTSVPSDEVIIQTENDLLEKIVNEKLERRLFRTVYLGRMVQVLLNEDFPDEVEAHVYKEKITEQLQNLKIVSNALKNVILKQQNVLQETIAAKVNLKEMQHDFKNKLIEQKQKSDEDKDKQLDSEYKERVINTEKRIAKLNFMRVLTSRLLLFGIDLENYEDYIQSLENLRPPITMDSFKN